MSLYSPLEQFEVKVLRPLVFFFDFSITTSTLYLFLVFSILGVFFYASVSRPFFIPSSWQQVAEGFYTFLFDMLKQTGNYPKGLPFFPLFSTVFLFILGLNLVGLLPFAFTVTAHLFVTFFLALSFNLGFFFLGFQKHGVYFLKFFVPSGVPALLLPLIVVIEVVSYAIRTFSLALRLFANMMAGHTLLQILSGFVIALGGLVGVFSYLAVVPFLLVFFVTVLEVGIAFIQAYVFTILLFIYLGDALNLH